MNTPALEPIETIPLDQIQVSNRLRSIDPDHAALIAQSFQANGQMTPIEVRRAADGGFLLVSGAHRLEAANIAGMGEIAAIIVEADDDQARLREIDENLCRRDLSELDRAAFLAERKAVWLKLHPETGRGKRGGGKGANLHLFPSFAQDAAEKLKISPSLVDRIIRRHGNLDAHARAILATSRHADNGSTLDAIARLPADRQRVVAAMLVRPDKPCRSVSEAVNEIVGKSPISEIEDVDRQYRALMSAWGKASRVAAKRRFLMALSGDRAARKLLAAALDAASDEQEAA